MSWTVPGMSFVRGAGFPPGRSITQTFPTATNASLLPSGDVLGHWMKRTCKVESLIATRLRTASDITRWTRAVKGMVVTAPVETSTRLSLPPSHAITALPSGVQANRGKLP